MYCPPPAAARMACNSSLCGLCFSTYPGHARTQELLEIRLIGVASQDDYLHRRPALAQRTGGEEAARSRHRQVHDDDIDAVALGTSYRIVAVAGLADDRHIGLIVNQQTQTFANSRVIFDQHNAQRFVHRNPPASLSLGRFAAKINYRGLRLTAEIRRATRRACHRGRRGTAAAFTTDADGRIDSWSQEAEALFEEASQRCHRSASEHPRCRPTDLPTVRDRDTGDGGTPVSMVRTPEWHAVRSEASHRRTQQTRRPSWDMFT